MNISRRYHRDVSAWLRHNLIAASLIILFAATVPRVFLTWRADSSDVIKSYGDPVTYIRPAQSLISQQAFLQDGKPEVTRTPGYPVFLASIMLLVSDDLATQEFNAFTLENFSDRINASMRPVLIVQALILSMEVVVLYWLARRILSPVAAFIGGLLAAFSPWGAFLAGLPMTEGLFLLLLALIFFIMKLTTERKNQTAVAIGGACTGLLTAAAVLVRPVWPLVLLIGGTFFILYGPKRKGVWLLLSMTLVFAIMPVFLWKARNWQVSQLDGLSDIGGKCAWRYLASRVRAEVDYQNRGEVWISPARWASIAPSFIAQAHQEERNWGLLSHQETDNERWRRAKVVFGEHPFLTIYSFARSAMEHAIHPSPGVLTPAKLNFYGDYLVLGLCWGGLLILACVGWLYGADADFENKTRNRNWLSGISVICLLLTLSSGLCFGAGSRYRVPLEIMVPLLAAAGLVYVFDRSSRTI
jgi:hypothetical protein